MIREPPKDAETYLYCNVVDGKPEHIHGSAVAVRCCGVRAEDVRRVEVTLAPDVPGTYWAWWDAENWKFCMVWPRKFLVEMCFTYGYAVEEERGRGKLVPVNVRVLED